MGERSKLRFHEGAHGTEFINHLRNNIAASPYPAWTGAVGQTRSDYRTREQRYLNGVQAFRNLLSAAQTASVQNVDCVGTKTIEQYHRENGTTTNVSCTP